MLKYFIMNANNSSSNSLPTLNSSEHIIKKGNLMQVMSKLF